MRARLVVSVSLLCTLFAASLYAATVDPAPAMNLAGIQRFTATPGAPGAAITWEVDRITRSESTGGGEAVTKKVYTASGASASFDLKKVSNKQTIWRIKAKDSAGTDSRDVQVFPAGKRSSFTFASTGNPTVRTYVVAPGSLSPSTKVLFVLHGQDRNADDYCNYWLDWARAHDKLLLCPAFDDNKWPGGRGYNRGNVFANDNDTKLNPESKWSFTIVEKIHTYARKGFKIDDPLFDIWGHSAGGQFLERFLLFKPNAKVRLAMPANPGWYIMPSLSVNYQCGAKHALLSFTQSDLLAFTELNAVLFRGTRDTNPSDPETGGCMDAQGRGRFARAGYFYNAVKALNPDTAWKLVDVVGVDHDGERMAKAAQDYLDDLN